jgi:hypothetical protein
MQHKASAIGPRFTLEQIAALVTSMEGSAWGFHVETDAGNLQVPEIAEVWRHHPTRPLFFITPLPSGDVEVYDVVHEIYRSGPIQKVLASIIEAEFVAA